MAPKVKDLLRKTIELEREVLKYQKKVESLSNGRHLVEFNKSTIQFLKHLRAIESDLPRLRHHQQQQQYKSHNDDYGYEDSNETEDTDDATTPIICKK